MSMHGRHRDRYLFREYYHDPCWRLPLALSSSITYLCRSNVPYEKMVVCSMIYSRRRKEAGEETALYDCVTYHPLHDDLWRRPVLSEDLDLAILQDP